MTEQESQDERSLRQLGNRVRSGWAKLHPLRPKTVTAVREAIREEWERKQRKTQQESAAETPVRAKAELSQHQDQQQAAKPQQKQRSSHKRKDQGWGHSH